MFNMPAISEHDVARASTDTAERKADEKDHGKV